MSLVPTVNQLSFDNNQGTATYDVYFDPSTPIRVTTTHDRYACSQWLSRNNMANGDYFPLGVAYHSDIANQVLTLSTRSECLVIQLSNLLPPHRDLLLFLRDDCTCFGYGLNGYPNINSFITDRSEQSNLRPILSFGRLIDLRDVLPDQGYTSLGDFSNIVLGGRVREPSTRVWRDLSGFPFLTDHQIQQTVSRAHVSFLIGHSYYYGPPLINHFSRGINNNNSNYPLKMREGDDNMGNWLKMAVNGNRGDNIKVHYTTNLRVLRRWLDKTEIEEGRSRLLGLAVTNTNDRGATSLVGVAHGKRCIVLDMSSTQLNDVSAIYYMAHRCPLAGWADNRDRVAGPLSNFLSRGVFNLQDEYHATHQFEDLSRIVLGYEKPLLTNVIPPASETEIMEVALQAYTCLLGGLHHNYHNCFIGDDGTWSK